MLFFYLKFCAKFYTHALPYFQFNARTCRTLMHNMPYDNYNMPKFNTHFFKHSCA